MVPLATTVGATVGDLTYSSAPPRAAGTRAPSRPIPPYPTITRSISRPKFSQAQIDALLDDLGDGQRHRADRHDRGRGAGEEFSAYTMRLTVTNARARYCR